MVLKLANYVALLYKEAIPCKFVNGCTCSMVILGFDLAGLFHCFAAEQASLAPSLVKLICYRQQIHENGKEIQYQKLNQEEETVFDRFNKVAETYVQ